MNDQPPLLEVERVTKRYPSAGGGEGLTVLRDLSLRVTAGESVAVVGPSGSGKSTLLNLVGGLDRPTAGAVRLQGRDLAALDDAEMAALRAAQIGLVFQRHHLLPQCTVWENVLVPTLACDRREAREPPEAMARRLLDRVGLAGRRRHRPGALSGGERQRVAVVRALINAPRLLLADEPTGSLDRAGAAALADLLVELNREERTTLIVVTHEAALAGRMRTRLTLRDGALHAGAAP
jgi:predicted ABC-type transport system involved in lysophospholipase L1 biosynthesis ATPase subunit